jgi:hypothetical protein
MQLRARAFLTWFSRRLMRRMTKTLAMDEAKIPPLRNHARVLQASVSERVYYDAVREACANDAGQHAVLQLRQAWYGSFYNSLHSASSHPFQPYP